jgi:hypothetical protein
MKKPEKLKLKAVGTKLVHDHDALRAGTCRYIGRRWDVNLKGWPVTEPSEVKPSPDYVLAVKHGDLAPANQETADYCGVSFDIYHDNETVLASNMGNYTGKF